MHGEYSRYGLHVTLLGWGSLERCLLGSGGGTCCPLFLGIRLRWHVALQKYWSPQDQQANKRGQPRWSTRRQPAQCRGG